jgi:hypothetical protein
MMGIKFRIGVNTKKDLAGADYWYWGKLGVNTKRDLAGAELWPPPAADSNCRVRAKK